MSIIVRPSTTRVTIQPQVTRVIEAGCGQSSTAPTDPSGSADRTFSQSDLTVANILVFTHGLGSTLAAATVWDSSGEQVMPDSIERLSVNIVAIDLSSFAPISGTYTISVTQ